MGGRKSGRVWAAAAVVLLAALTGVGLWRTAGGPPNLVAITSEPEGIMGTSCQLSAVVVLGQAGRAREALTAAEAELRRVEALMSTWIEGSEISRLNHAPPGEAVPLSRESRFVLGRARQLARETGGAFDVTCRPLVELWRRAGKRDELPSAEELAAALSLVGWREIRLEPGGAVKAAAGARVDLGGIAKGYGIDLAAEAMQAAAGLRGGLVDVGGDLRLFGQAPTPEGWVAAIRSPAGDAVWAEITLSGGAVCTSGHALRFETIEGRRYSHIIDPRSGRPASGTVSVTVVGPTALDADAWATALSVLGPEGLERLEGAPGIEALVISRGEGGLRADLSPGFPELRPGPGFPATILRH